MAYPINQPPVIKKFGQMTREEAQAYYDWFIDQTPVRIQALEKAVQATPGYDDWTADGKPQSLVLLGKWFCQKITFAGPVDPLHEPALGVLPAGVALPKASDLAFPSETISIVLDVAMYFSQVLFQAIPGLRWKLVTISKVDVNYQQPVIVGKGPVPLNPFHVLMVYAYGVRERIWGPTRLRELYNIWFNSLA